jgi:primosomal protein N' (replication factor Y)
MRISGSLPDFRAEERTFQLLTQLAGRSGRDREGRVLVQTFMPDARPIALAARHAVAEFLAGELERRRELGYPPFRRLIRILASGGSAGAPIALLTELREALAAVPGDHELLGPAPLLRLRGRFRAQLLVKVDDPRAVAGQARRMLAAASRAMRRDGLAVVVDVDPQSL